MSDNLFALFRNRFPADLSRPFLIRRDGTVLSYGDLLAESGRLATLFSSRGIVPGDRIALKVDKSVEALLVYLASLRVGAVFLPLNPAYTPVEVSYFIEDAQPALFICDAAMLDNLIEAARDRSPDFDDVARASDDLAAILYTSGTTGRSKGAMLTHGNLASNAETLRREWRFTPEDRLIHALPIFHTHGLFVATNVTLVTGSSMIFLPTFDAGEIVRLLPEASVLMGVPTFYTRLLADPALTRDAAQHMRLFVSGSAPLSAETHREFEDRTGHAILERYGMTETNMNSSNPYDGPRAAGSVGPPLPGVEIRIADPETGRPTPGKIGVIEIRGPNVFKGYWNMPEKTAAEFRADGFFISGDLGHFDERGYLHIVGRAKDLVISGGFNVYPAEVEAAIEALPGVAECAVIGAPHPDFGEGVIAAIVARPGASVDVARIEAALKDQLARYKQPKRIYVLPELPRNAMGKVQKQALRDLYADTFVSARK